MSSNSGVSTGVLAVLAIVMASITLAMQIVSRVSGKPVFATRLSLQDQTDSTRMIMAVEDGDVSARVFFPNGDEVVIRAEPDGEGNPGFVMRRGGAPLHHGLRVVFPVDASPYLRTLEGEGGSGGIDRGPK